MTETNDEPTPTIQRRKAGRYPAPPGKTKGGRRRQKAAERPSRDPVSSSVPAVRSRAPAPSDAFLALPAVIHRSGLSRSSLLRGVRDGSFPKPVKVSARAVRWLESAVSEWMQARLRDGCPASVTEAVALTVRAIEEEE